MSKIDSVWIGRLARMVVRSKPYKAGGLTTPEEFEAFHDAITGQGITDFHELVEIAKQVKAGGV